MTTLTIQHTTTYRYREAVTLGPHRLMLRPRESNEVRLLSMDLTIEPPATVTWAQDVAGNAVGMAAFSSPSDALVIANTLTVQLAASSWPVFPIAASAITYPFQYDRDECVDLGALTNPGYDDPNGHLHAWINGFVQSNRTDTLSLLKDINAGILSHVVYQSRDAEGAQSPLETLGRGLGSCRDLSVLFIGGVRRLGFGARIVSGYLHAPLGLTAGTTHAWAEVFVPGAGWIMFDPTNRSVGAAHLVPVAVGRNISQVVPIAGSFIGASDAFCGMTVEVNVG